MSIEDIIRKIVAKFVGRKKITDLKETYHENERYEFEGKLPGNVTFKVFYNKYSMRGELHVFTNGVRKVHQFQARISGVKIEKL
jgi:hypothetical protein